MDTRGASLPRRAHRDLVGRLGGYGPDSPCRLVVATTDPASLPEKATWYLATILPHPDAPHATTSPRPPADLTEIVRLYSLRPWIEQSYEQIKDKLGWADFQVRSDRAIRRDQTLVTLRLLLLLGPVVHPTRTAGCQRAGPVPRRRAREGDPPRPTSPNSPVGQGLTRYPFLAHPSRHPQPMVASLDGHGPTLRAPGPDRRSHHRTQH
ncbi:hypothetical protein [Streptomyces sp. NPDC005209]|uniref:hypothetical protein n=1 Tax=Streptomyces sp. NPDC005209 TaxID=3156715 RepID=UPI0033B872AF